MKKSELHDKLQNLIIEFDTYINQGLRMYTDSVLDLLLEQNAENKKKQGRGKNEKTT